MAHTELDLLSAAKMGDAAALDEILERHEKQVFRFGLRMCGSEEDAREVLQDTLLAAFEGLRDFRGDAQLSTWLFQIARSFCVKRRRRPSGAPAEPLPLESPEATAVPMEAPLPDERAHAREIGALLQTAILGLSDAHREVVLLRDVEGLSAQEAAKVLDIELAALKSRLHRARLDLRERLSVLLGPGAPEGASPCIDLAHELAAYAGAEIDQATCARIEEHLARCARCADACKTLQRSVSLCREIPGGEVPRPIRSAVRKALRDAMNA
ncbi:MAG: sigma-70 family RNA polymerase sigma factor [Myxococcales bacterium]